jgi:hypothetical protein
MLPPCVEKSIRDRNKEVFVLYIIHASQWEDVRRIFLVYLVSEVERTPTLILMGHCTNNVNVVVGLRRRQMWMAGASR